MRLNQHASSSSILSPLLLLWWCSQKAHGYYCCTISHQDKHKYHIFSSYCLFLPQKHLHLLPAIPPLSSCNSSIPLASVFSSYSHLSLVNAASHRSLCIVHLFPLPCLVLLCARLLRFHPLLLDTWIHAFTWEPFYSSHRALSCAAYTRSCQSVGAVSESEWTGGGARSHLSYVMLHSLLPALFFLPQFPILSTSLHHDLLPCFHVAMQAPGIFASKKK